MKKKVSVLLIFLGCFMVAFGVSMSIFSEREENVEPIKEENDEECINAFLANNYLLRTFNIDDVKIEFNFLNCKMKEKKEEGRYFLSSPQNSFSIESYLSNSSPASTALEIFDTYSEMEKYSSKNIEMKSAEDEDGILYRIITVVPSDEIYDNNDFYHEYVIVYTVEAGKTVVLKVKVNNKNKPTKLFEDVFATFKIIK